MELFEVHPIPGSPRLCPVHQVWSWSQVHILNSVAKAGDPGMLHGAVHDNICPFSEVYSSLLCLWFLLSMLVLLLRDTEILFSSKMVWLLSPSVQYLSVSFIVRVGEGNRYFLFLSLIIVYWICLCVISILCSDIWGKLLFLLIIACKTANYGIQSFVCQSYYDRNCLW